MRYRLWAADRVGGFTSENNLNLFHSHYFRVILCVLRFTLMIPIFHYMKQSSTSPPPRKYSVLSLSLFLTSSYCKVTRIAAFKLNQKYLVFTEVKTKCHNIGRYIFAHANPLHEVLMVPEAWSATTQWYKGPIYPKAKIRYDRIKIYWTYFRGTHQKVINNMCLYSLHPVLRRNVNMRVKSMYQ